MRDPLRISKIETQEAFDQFVQFAQSFGHNEGEHTILPVYTIGRGEKMIAYFKALTQPVILPAFHPDLVTPRDFHEIVDKVKFTRFMNSISQQFPNGTAFIGVENSPAINPKIIENLGFKNLNMQLWQANG